MSIFFNNSSINDWNFGNDNIIKVYRHNAVCYYKVTGGGDTPTAQTPCFAVVDDISQYTDREFEDVYDNATEKWYKLNNLSQYEEYGVYGSGRTITTYEGKLTIDYADDGEDYSTHYLTMVAQTDNVTFSYSTATSSNKLQYSVDSGSTWNDLSNGSSTSSINNGDRIMFKASGLTVNTERGIGKIIPSASASVEGNIMSLEYGDNFSGQTTIQNNYQFRKLFSGVTTITSAENMVLPATTVKQQCYSQMFQGCTSLVVSPKVIGSSAMTWSGQYCLSDMFHDCTSLTTVPSGLLPATTLGERCYWCMFNNCTSLTTAPTLPATTLVSNCYLEMFKGCTNLNYIEALFTTTPSSSYMSNWVNGVASSGTFVKNSSATWSTSCGVSTYPCNWTVQDYVEPTPIKYEYIYSGGYWVNVGEVSGSTIIIKSPEYIEKDSSHNGKINLDYVWKTNSKMQFKFYSTNNGGGAMIGEDGMPDNNDCRMFFASTTAYFDWGSNRISWSSNGMTNTLYEYEYGNYYIKNMVTSASKTGSAISTSRTNTLYFGLDGTDRFRTYYLKFYDGDTLVKDFIPWTDMEGNYGFFDKVSLSVYNVASGTLTGSSNVTDVEVGGGIEYPLEYVVREDPPNNLVFSSMTEAEAYECPWVGMNATIDGDKYVFSGDSQSGYEWVYNPSRLPSGYTEVEYVQNTGTSTINTNFYPNTNTRVLCEMEMITTQTYPKLFGAGTWNVNNSLYIEFATSLSVHWIGSTSTYSDYPKSFAFAKHEYDLNKGNLYIDDTLVGTKSYSSVVSVSSPFGIFSYINGSTAGNADEHFLGKLYTFKIYDDGTLVREFIPAKRDSDNVGGLYDIVNDVFYTPMESNAPLVVGNPI